MNLKMGCAAGLSAVALVAAGPAFAWTYEEAAAPYKGVEISILDEVTPLQEQFADIVPQFEEETGIKVNYQLMNHFEVINRGQADMLSGRGEYDAVMAHSLQVGLLMDAGVLLPIEDFVKDEKLVNPEFDVDDLIDPAFKSLAYLDDTLYSFLNWNYNMVYWGRNDLLTHPDEQAAFEEKYGYKLAPATTFQQLHDIAEFFTRPAGETLAGETLDSDFYGIVMEGMNGGGTYVPVWQIFIKNSGGDIFDADGHPTFDTPEVIAGLKMYGDLWAFSPPGQAEYSLIDVPTVMGNGIAAQSIAYSDFVLGIDREGASALHGQFVYGAPPTHEGNEAYHSAGEPSAYFISRHSDNPEATFLFLQWAAEKKTQEALLSSGVGVPVRDGSWAELMTKGKELSGLYDAMKASMAGIEATPKAPRWAQISDAMNRVFQQVGLGQLTAEEAAAQLQQDVTAICDPCLIQ
ncbi:extracellular solute-binding protein [Acuticoccus sp. MNP-M23]|uniref:ABC transporter substrate-binding protein n=1 Tax=Acuticoccus sp. MNP-M23 TaxID=3072793 RepID=UPI002814BEEB|nr:extracellular solute-binding protein [Acuticoccus sp. MNP-M23]WMS42301.1 extracellular solute-binding protein [Acuticoccus sp. MNP-M23]